MTLAGIGLRVGAILRFALRLLAILWVVINALLGLRSLTCTSVRLLGLRSLTCTSVRLRLWGLLWCAVCLLFCPSLLPVRSIRFALLSVLCRLGEVSLQQLLEK